MQYNSSIYGRLGYAVDLVLCIDGTATMNDIGIDKQSHLSRVKAAVRRIEANICETMNRRGKIVEQLRARIIVFRDYLTDGQYAMMHTDFFQLPQQKEALERCLDSIRADGGGDEPEDGLEALAYAIRSDWDTKHMQKRQVIMVWSDAGTHDLGHGIKAQHYPKGMARNLDELENWWEEIGRSKRLILFTPNEYFWRWISDNWELSLHVPSVAGEGLHDRDYEDILRFIANNV